MRALVLIRVIPRATPRLRSNQWVTATTPGIDSAPWPSMRIPTNPAASHATLATSDMWARAIPNPIPIATVERRAPTLSMRRPMAGRAAEPSSVPTR